MILLHVYSVLQPLHILTERTLLLFFRSTISSPSQLSLQYINKLCAHIFNWFAKIIQLFAIRLREGIGSWQGARGAQSDVNIPWGRAIYESKGNSNSGGVNIGCFAIGREKVSPFQVEVTKVSFDEKRTITRHISRGSGEKKTQICFFLF